MVERKSTGQNYNRKVVERKGHPKRVPLSSSRVPPHEQKPLPEPLEISIPVRRVYHGLGDVVPGFDLRVAQHDPEFVLREPPGFFLVSHAPWTGPSSDPMGPSPRSKDSGLIPKEGKTRWNPYGLLSRWFFSKPSVAKEAFSFNGNRQKL